MLALVALLVTGCTEMQSNTIGSEIDSTGDESTDNLAGDISDFEELDSELEDLDNFNLDDLDF